MCSKVRPPEAFVKAAWSDAGLPEPAQVELLRNEVYMRCQKRATFGAWTFDSSALG
jgi:hypothetical protein